MGTSILGTRVLRIEDPDLLTGAGDYVDDLADDPRLAGALHVHFVRSTMAHARIEVDASEALGAPGVRAVVTAADLDLGSFPPDAPAFPAGMARPWLAIDVVRYVGEAVVVIVADTRAQAADAAELVVVHYDPLPVVIDPAYAVTDEVLLFPEYGTNLALAIPHKGSLTPQDIDACEVVVRLDLVNCRIAPAPMEPRASAAMWGDDGRITFWTTCQGVHPIRDRMAAVYGMDPTQVRGITPHVGGGFGAKASPYPEDLLLPWIARHTGRPVRWVSTRSEDMVNLGHGRATTQRLVIGGSRDGHLHAYQLEVLADCGAYPRFGAFLPTLTKLMQSGCYFIPKTAYSARAVVTNTTPVVAYRGAGRPEAAAAIERAVDAFAAEIGMDPAEVRRINALTPEQFPYRTPTGAEYDSGSYVAALDQALALAGIDGLRAEQAARRVRSATTQLGIGLALYVEVTGAGGAPEYGRVDVLADGRIRALTGTSPHGQGHYTAWAMLISERLGVPMSDIEVVHGDTDIVPTGGVTGGSRSLQTGGVAIHQAAGMVADRAREVAAELLEADPADVVMTPADRTFHVNGTPSIVVSWGDVVTAAYRGFDPHATASTGASMPELDVEAQSEDASGADGAGASAAVSSGEAMGPLGVEHRFGSGKSTFPSGAHVAVVEVDTETGKVTLRRLVAVDDAGRILNPNLAEGQVHGGLAQGAAQALLEEFRYDEIGNPMTSNFADYPVISAAELPTFELGHLETPTPTNELGAKGIGESGTIGATPAVQNAVVDALSHLGVRHIDMPTTPERVWSAIQACTVHAG